MPDCIFCKIASNQVPAPKLYEDERFFCIRDIQPMASQHLLIIPKEHVTGLDQAYPEKGASRAELIGGLFQVAAQVARSQGMAGGYRAVINNGADGGQTVHHLHLHLLGGERLQNKFA
jgi:histidine triad (HIT) family protein